MMKEDLQVSGMMDINTKQDINVLCDLLETLESLRVTFKIDKVYLDPNKNIKQVYYVWGMYK